MRKFVILWALLLSSVQATAMSWTTPIEKYYQTKDPALYEKYREARTLIDTYSGQRDQREKAATILKEVLDTDNQFAPAYRELSRVLMLFGSNKQKYEDGAMNPSEELLLAALQIEPEYADAYVLMGHMYTAMGRTDEAEEALNRAEEIGTDNPWLDTNRASLLSELRRYRESLARYEAIIAKGPSHPRTYGSALSRASTLYTFFSELDKANETYLNMIEHEPKNPWVRSDYGRFLLHYYEDEDGAIEQAEDAIQILNYLDARVVLASALYTKWAYLKDEDPYTAQMYFDQAQLLVPMYGHITQESAKYRYTLVTADALTEHALKTTQEQREKFGPKE